MAKKPNDLAGLMNALGKSGKTGTGGIPNLAGQAQTVRSAGKLGAGSAGGSKTRSLTAANLSSSGIDFGRPASSKTSTTSKGTDWGKLLEQTASGGISSFLGGGLGLGSIAGLGSIVSGIASLFGKSKSAPAPLTRFALPAAQNQTITVSNAGTSGSGAAPGQSTAHDSAQIVQAVKTALLHSSSLNDVISEL